MVQVVIKLNGQMNANKQTNEEDNGQSTTVQLAHG
jgi:hypothetical protein